MGRILLNISRGGKNTMLSTPKETISGNGFKINGEGFKINGEGFKINGEGFTINGGAIQSEETTRKEIPANFRKIKLDKNEKKKNNIRLIL